MKRFSLVAAGCASVLAIAFSVTAPGVAAQAPSRFKNIQTLKGLSDKEIQEAMGVWARQLGVKCVDCHVQGDFASDEKPQKKTARLMYQMVQALNQQEFFKSSERKADCFLCHKGSSQIAPTAD